MGVYVNTTGLNDDCIPKLTECKWGLEDIYEDLIGCKFPSDGTYQMGFQISVQIINQKIEDMIEKIDGDIANVESVINQFDNAEARNRQISNSFVSGGSTSIAGSGVRSTSRNSDVPTKDANTKLEDDKGIQTETPNKAEDVDNEEVDIDLEGKVPDSQVEAVIELIYGEEPTLSDDDRQRIAEAILQINETEILEGLDESIANSIRADIVKDYLDGKLELEGITADQLQQYIESQPSINVKFELNESINSFDSLIANGYLTEEQINSVIEQNIQICTEEEFTDAYKEFDNTQTDVSNIESFYDKENNKVYIRNTADSVLITKAIISVLGANILFDDETGQVSYVTDVEDTNINDFSSISMNGEENTVLNDKTNLEDETNLSE